MVSNHRCDHNGSCRYAYAEFENRPKEDFPYDSRGKRTSNVSEQQWCNSVGAIELLPGECVTEQVEPVDRPRAWISPSWYSRILLPEHIEAWGRPRELGGSSAAMEGAMKVGMPVALFALSLSSIQLCGQCARPELKPVWDPAQQQFKCVSPSGYPAPPPDSVISAKGDKDFCGGIRDNLQKVCPSSDEGKICKSKAKSIFNSCYKDFKGQSSVGSGIYKANPQKDG